MSLRESVLQWMRVTDEAPPAPLGSHRVLRVERAAPGYLNYLRIRWAVQSLAELAGTVAFASAMFAGGGRGWLVLLEVFLLSVVVVRTVARFIVLKLDYELRWYVITDKSLRIREGIWSVREITLTFANVQNVSVTQGPLQRLFGVSEVVVETAGGGGGQQQKGQNAVLGHQGRLRGVANPHQLRDLIVELLRKEKGAGLGERPRAERPRPAPASAARWSPAALDALRQVAAAARA